MSAHQKAPKVDRPKVPSPKVPSPIEKDPKEGKAQKAERDPRETAKAPRDANHPRVAPPKVPAQHAGLTIAAIARLEEVALVNTDPSIPMSWPCAKSMNKA